MNHHAAESSNDESSTTPLRMLIAEDELLLAYVLRRQLERRGVKVVGLATNGREVVECCRELHPDLILMDVRMPETDGLAATRLVMEHCPTCVILVTAFADEETRSKAEAVGAMGFLSKPIQATGVMEQMPKAQARFGEFEVIRAESSDLEQALHTRGLVEAAKSALIAGGVAPEAAFRVLKESAESAGLSLRAMAESIAEGDQPGDTRRVWSSGESRPRDRGQRPQT